MSTSDFSKRMIAQGMKDLLKSAPLDSISVGDLARYCQVSRSTVYYHFKDKYDIISWIFHSEITPLVSAGRQVGNWTDNLMVLCTYFQSNREFYSRVLRDVGQNSFYECLTDFCRELISHMFRESGGDRVLDPVQIRIISAIYSYGIVGCIADWSRTGMQGDPSSFVKTVKELISGQIFQKVVTAAEQKSKDF